jgi:hypothetical protein
VSITLEDIELALTVAVVILLASTILASIVETVIELIVISLLNIAVPLVLVVNTVLGGTGLLLF